MSAERLESTLDMGVPWPQQPEDGHTHRFVECYCVLCGTSNHEPGHLDRCVSCRLSQPGMFDGEVEA